MGGRIKISPTADITPPSCHLPTTKNSTIYLQLLLLFLINPRDVMPSANSMRHQTSDVVDFVVDADFVVEVDRDAGGGSGGGNGVGVTYCVTT